MKVSRMIVALAFYSSGLMAQDYYSPTDKEKEPVARFPFKVNPEIRVDKGEKVIKYTLPTQLTGNVNEITAKAVVLPGMADLPNAVQIFVGEKATLTCMGTDQNPGCMVTHHDLSVDKDLAFKEIDNTYYDPELRLAARKVVEEFQDPIEHSGNQPIGIIGALKQPPPFSFPRGTMRTFFTRPTDGFNTATITWKKDKVNDKDVLGSEAVLNVPGSDAGKLYNVAQFGNRVRGLWTVAGNSGWFDFEFTADKSRFKGTFGYYGDKPDDKQNVRAGVWNSNAQ